MQLNNDNLKIVLSNNIKSARLSSNLTQENLAELSDISLNFIRGIEGCRSGVSLSTLITLCHSLNITPTEILKDFFKESFNESEKMFEKLLSLNNYQKTLVYNIIQYFYDNEMYK